MKSLYITWFGGHDPWSLPGKAPGRGPPGIPAQKGKGAGKPPSKAQEGTIVPEEAVVVDGLTKRVDPDNKQDFLVFHEIRGIP